MIWPAIVQQFQVKPSEADKEAPYIEDNIEATRAAYDLDDVEVRRRTTRRSTATRTELRSTPQTVVGARWSTRSWCRQTFEQLQQVRAYYSVAERARRRPLRRSTAARPRAGARRARARPDAASTTATSNWSNLHTVYTHGYGVIAAYGNQRTATTRRSRRRRAAVGRGHRAGAGRAQRPATGGFEPRIYFGEQSPEYSIVGKAGEGAADVELDLPPTAATSDEAQTRRRTTARAASPSAASSTSCCTPSSSASRTSCCPAGSTRTARSSTTATRASGSRRSRRG